MYRIPTAGCRGGRCPATPSGRGSGLGRPPAPAGSYSDRRRVGLRSVLSRRPATPGWPGLGHGQTASRSLRRCSPGQCPGQCPPPKSVLDPARRGSHGRNSPIRAPTSDLHRPAQQQRPRQFSQNGRQFTAVPEPSGPFNSPGSGRSRAVSDKSAGTETDSTRPPSGNGRRAGGTVPGTA